jgi:hypothetical protein
VHSVGAGTGNGVDTGHAWSTAIYVLAALVVAAAIALRLTVRAGMARRAPAHPPLGAARRPVPVLADERTDYVGQPTPTAQGARLPVPTASRSLS